MTSPQTSPGRVSDVMMLHRRHVPSYSVIVAALSVTTLLMFVTNCLEIAAVNSEVHSPVRWADQARSEADKTSCECLLELHCPRYSFKYPQERQSICKIQSYSYQSAKQCLEWRSRHLSTGRTHLVLLGDLRLLYLYRFIRDQLMSQTERVEGPAFCRSIYKNWTHAYEHEEGAEQPLEPCRFVAVSHLVKLEYVWTSDSLWSNVLNHMLHRCQQGSCPSLVVVSPRLDLALKSYRDGSDLWVGRTNNDVFQSLPLLERLRASGVHVWWKPHENLLDVANIEDISSYNELAQLLNIRVMKLLKTSTVPVWTSTNAISWMHHLHCETVKQPPNPLTPDHRCHHPYYLGNWAQRQYMDIMLNFLCGRAPSMPLNPCCTGWA